jgi:hypothetical protein
MGRWKTLLHTDNRFQRANHLMQEKNYRRLVQLYLKCRSQEQQLLIARGEGAVARCMAVG